MPRHEPFSKWDELQHERTTGRADETGGAQKAPERARDAATRRRLAGRIWMLRLGWIVSTGMLVAGGLLIVLILAGYGSLVGL